MECFKTVAAIATPPGQGAVALVRVTGPEAVAVAGRIFRRRAGSEGPATVAVEMGALAPRVQHFGQIWDAGAPVDEVLLTVFRAPASFTGEDVVEIACHGGGLVTRRVLEAVFRAGAGAAGPGEFTRRAYRNGKLDLTQAEAIMDVVLAQSDLALRTAARQLGGSLGVRVRDLQSRLLDVLAHLEAYIDFPEEDIAPETGSLLQARMTQVHIGLEKLLSTARHGRVLRTGVRTVLSGAPNAGKSSLLNRLLGYERAIVSPVPGTTRDTLEEVVMIRGWSLRLIDTAGLREGGDALEQLGMARTLQQLEDADLILQIFDGQESPGDSVVPLDPRVLRVLNKLDLGEHPDWGGLEAVRVSCLTGEGMEALEEAIVAKMAAGIGPSDAGDEIAINARHQDCVRRSLDFLGAAEEALAGGIPPEFIAEELRASLEALGEVVGRVDNEDLLGRIFSSFCIGK
jgi:tRNA modification GTPase